MFLLCLIFQVLHGFTLIVLQTEFMVKQILRKHLAFLNANSKYMYVCIYERLVSIKIVSYILLCFYYDRGRLKSFRRPLVAERIKARAATVFISFPSA